ncbi:RHS repeat protein, partial [Bradyrhizobium sp. CNPSo 4010]
SQGNIVSVTDALGKTITYAYDAFGNLTRTTDPSGNVSTATYDPRGAKIVDADPDMGSWSYSYNTLGLPVSQTDAKGQTVNLTYDKLDRVIQRVEPDKTSTWTYDTAAHGIGKLASTAITAGAGAGYSRSVSYDALSRATQVAMVIDGATYNMSATYDANGQLSKVGYPSGFTARYAYTSLGDVNQLFDDATGQVQWTANAMDAEGHLTQQTAGNGLLTTKGFDALTGRLTSVATGSGSAVQNLSVTYDKRGNPLSRNDANTNLSETFTYDGLNRLLSSTVNLTPTPLSKTFSYDPIGNLLSKSDVGSYTYPAAGQAQPHAVTSIGAGLISTTFTYDLNGNQTSGLGRTIAWTSYNKPASITQGTRTISFVDDTDHQRFKQVTPEGTKLYLSAFGVSAEVTNPGTSSQIWTDYLSVGDAMVGMRTVQVVSETVATRYFHSDHLGSIAVITDEAGAVVERLSYDAWGKRRNPNGTDDTTGSITSQSSRGFTGEEQLSVSGLVHLNGRVYDPIVARMTSADPTIPRPLSTQGWNRYTYVYNAPLNLTDPTGYCGSGPDGFVGACLDLTPHEVTSEGSVTGSASSSGWMVYPTPLPTPTVFPAWVDPCPICSANLNLSPAPPPISVWTPALVAGIEAYPPQVSQVQPSSPSSLVQQVGYGAMPPQYVPADSARQLLNQFYPGAQYMDLAQNAWRDRQYGAATLYGAEALADSALALSGGKLLGAGIVAGVDALRSLRGVGAANRAAHELYKDGLRAAMSKPAVSDPELARLLDQLYRPNATVGSGSTAAAIREELKTGQAVGGAFHSQKAGDSIRALERWLSNNLTARPGDRAAAENVIRDMRNALGGR